VPNFWAFICAFVWGFCGWFWAVAAIAKRQRAAKKNNLKDFMGNDEVFKGRKVTFFSGY
jgi:hypothetical protein